MMLREVRHYVAEQTLVPPVPMADLKEHADELLAALGTKEIYRDYLGILINNELWRETLATVPFERRLLMIPKCLTKLAAEADIDIPLEVLQSLPSADEIQKKAAEASAKAEAALSAQSSKSVSYTHLTLPTKA